MEKTLVIVESPAKAKTIEKFLPKGCTVVASMGHIIDLPSSKIGVDVNDGYKPHYITIKGKAKLLNDIKELAKKSDRVILATDPDREGEAISYHLANALGMDLNDNNRIEFHEITKNAITSAMDNKRKVNIDLFYAQQARRILDRLVGYQISPVLWKNIMGGLSAGRVQSVATRLICEREQEIEAFVPVEYWDIASMLTKHSYKTPFKAKLTLFDGKEPTLSCQADTVEIVNELNTLDYFVEKVDFSTKKRKPFDPYTTSSLQQDANRRLSYSSSRTMRLAQDLYEGMDVPGRGHMGLVTYIRTDSVRISDEAKAQAKSFIEENFGKNYLSSGARASKKKGNVQDAHEAIRPTDVTFTPSMAAKCLNRDQAKLYELIYNRFLASQMADAEYNSISYDFTCGHCTLHSTGSTLKFDGFLKVYSVKEEDEVQKLPNLEVGEKVDLNEVLCEQKFTNPPARYNEASLIKALEEMGVGRPSTYAPTIKTIQDREYVSLDQKKFYPTETGKKVNEFLCKNFKDVVDYKFTAKMEDDLDKIAEGDQDWVKTVDSLNKKITKDIESIDLLEKVTIEIGENCPLCGCKLIIKSGRYGKFVACSNYPECTFTKPIKEPKTVNVEVDPNAPKRVCEKCGRDMVLKKGKFGMFYACTGYPKCKNTISVENKIDVKCPKCGKDVVVKRSKRGKIFYGCQGYPDCDFVSWDMPTNEKCPDCGEVLYKVVRRNGTNLVCKNEDCGFKKPAEE